MSSSYNLLYHHIILFMVFFIIYALLYNYDVNSFNGVNDNFDLFYFTAVTQSSTGYGDITPKSKISKLAVSLHVMLAIMISIQFVFALAEMNKN